MPSRNVALLIETSNAYARGILSGVVDFIRAGDHWSIFLPEQNRGARPPLWLSKWNGDGIIARIETKEIAKVIEKTGLPIVDVSAARHIPTAPWVETNDETIGKLAFTHFDERGYSNFAFCGESCFNWSRWRQQSFEREVRKAGKNYFECNTNDRGLSNPSWGREKELLAAWLTQLPRPVGIFSCYDIKAQKILDVCRELEIAVPEEIAVLGVDNDELLCELATPALSSIVCNTRQTGFQAAQLLDRLMRGETVDTDSIRVKPLGIRTRQSTDVLAVSDPIVATALQFIREHAYEDINVSDVVRAASISRRMLENRFQKILGRTPHDEIVRLRIARAKQLLVETDLPLTKVALKAGYENTEYLSAVFKKIVGVPPGQYRRSQKGPSLQ